MPSRPTWTGSISFGLVNIPVGLYPATQDNELSFHFMHKEDQGRIRNQRVCSECGKTVDYDDLVRGYEYSKGSYVTLTDDDFKKVNVETTQAIVIVDFVQGSEIDPMFFDKPYYLTPGKKSDGPYVLLREALRESGMVGIRKGRPAQPRAPGSDTGSWGCAYARYHALRVRNPRCRGHSHR